MAGHSSFMKSLDPRSTYLLRFLTLSNEAFGRVGSEPRLGVCGLIRLLDKLKLTWDLPVIEEAQCLCSVLHIFHVLEVELKEHNSGGKIKKVFSVTQLYPFYICIRLKAQDEHGIVRSGLHKIHWMMKILFFLGGKSTGVHFMLHYITE